MRALFAASCLALALAACQTPLRANPDRIAPWTYSLRDSQPESPTVAVYVHGERRLVFVAAHHENTTDSATFRIIEDAYALMQFDTLIVEGMPYARGPNPQRTLDWLATQQAENGFVEGGEFVPAATNALAQGAKIWGGELNDTEIRDRLLAQGFTAEDLVGFYTLRSVPQWIRERHIEDAADPALDALVITELARNHERLGLQATALSDPPAWRAWYEATNGKPLDGSFQLEEVGPLADGRYATNRIGAAIGRARDEFLLDRIAYHLNLDEDVIVVFGQSHYVMLQPALDEMLRPPCYLGEALRDAPPRCLG